MASLEELAAASPDGQVPNASLPSGWAPSVTYDPSGRAEVVTLGAGQPGDESTWTDEVRALGVDVPPGWSARLVQVSHDPKAWVRNAQGEDAVTEPVTRRKYVVEPTRAPAVDVDELVAAIGKKRPKLRPATGDAWAYVHTIAVGSVTQGTAVAVTNTGSSSAAVFDFVLVKGDKGDTGNTGATGSTGAAAQHYPQLYRPSHQDQH